MNFSLDLFTLNNDSGWILTVHCVVYNYIQLLTRASLHGDDNDDDEEIEIRLFLLLLLLFLRLCVCVCVCVCVWCVCVVCVVCVCVCVLFREGVERTGQGRNSKGSNSFLAVRVTCLAIIILTCRL